MADFLSISHAKEGFKGVAETFTIMNVILHNKERHLSPGLYARGILA